MIPIVNSGLVGIGGACHACSVFLAKQDFSPSPGEILRDIHAEKSGADHHNVVGIRNRHLSWLPLCRQALFPGFENPVPAISFQWKQRRYIRFV